MPIYLGFWEWGCPKRKDGHITVTAVEVIETQNIPFCFTGNSHDMQVHDANTPLAQRGP